MARIDETQRASKLIALFSYLTSRGLFDKSPCETDRDTGECPRSVPLEDVAHALDITKTAAGQLVERLACCGQDTHILIPVYVDMVDDVPYVFGSPFPTPSHPIRLTALECLALTLSLRPFGVEDVGGLLDRIGTPVFSDAALQSIVLNVDHEKGGALGDKLCTIAQAIDERRVLHIAYRKTDQEAPERRDVEPLDLYIDRGSWHLCAWCRKRGDYRTFLVDNIMFLTLSRNTFRERMELTASVAELLSSHETETATLHFDADSTIDPREWPGILLERTLEDGTVEALVPYLPTSSYLALEVVSHLGKVTVVSPPELVSRVHSFARRRIARAEMARKAWGEMNVTRVGSPDIGPLSPRDAGREKARLSETLDHTAS